MRFHDADVAVQMCESESESLITGHLRVMTAFEDGHKLILFEGTHHLCL